MSVHQLLEVLAAYGTEVLDMTVERELASLGYCYRRPPRGPMISGEHKQNRVIWCFERQAGDIF